VTGSGRCTSFSVTIYEEEHVNRYENLHVE